MAQLGQFWFTCFSLFETLAGRHHLPRLCSSRYIRTARSQLNKHVWGLCSSRICQCPINKIKPYSQAQSQWKYTLPTMRPWQGCGCIILPQGREREPRAMQSTAKYIRTEIPMAIFNEKNQAEGFTSLDIKTYYKTYILKQCHVGMRTNKYPTWIEERVQKQTYLLQQRRYQRALVERSTP